MANLVKSYKNLILLTINDFVGISSCLLLCSMDLDYFIILLERHLCAQKQIKNRLYRNSCLVVIFGFVVVLVSNTQHNLCLLFSVLSLQLIIVFVYAIASNTLQGIDFHCLFIKLSTDKYIPRINLSCRYYIGI